MRFRPSPTPILTIDTGIRPLIQIAGIGWLVNKKDLVGKVAMDARLTRAQAARALDAFLHGIQTSLASGDHVTLSGFGTFGVRHRKARQVRNPRNGRAMVVAAKSVPRFAPGADLKNAMLLTSDSKQQNDGSGIGPRMNTEK